MSTTSYLLYHLSLYNNDHIGLVDSYLSYIISEIYYSIEYMASNLVCTRVRYSGTAMAAAGLLMTE